MKNLAIFGRKFLDVDIREIPVPPVGEDEVLIKVHACGICGTDLHFLRDCDDGYHPLGHEIAAEVMECGKLVRNVSPGDKVIVEDCSACGVCRMCKSGLPEACRNMYTLNGRPGMSQYMVLNYHSLVKFDGMDYISASLTEPLAVALSAVENARIPIGGSVLIFGPGPIGQLATAVAKLKGAGKVIMAGLGKNNVLDRFRLDFSIQAGADMVLKTSMSDWKDKLLAEFPEGVDRVIVTAPPRTLPDAIDAVRYAGIITFLGLDFSGRNKIEFDVNNAIFKKLELKATFAEPAVNFPVAIELLRSKKIMPELFITGTYGLDGLRDVAKGIIEEKVPQMKCIISPWMEM